MNKDLLFYAKKFAQLKVDRARGVAPHKPILLLSVIELVQQGHIKQNQIYLSPELIATFLKYWSSLGSKSHRSDIALPFFHLTSEKFWHLAPNPGFESVITSKIRLKSLTALRNAVNYAFLDQALFDLLLLSTARNNLIQILMDTWFQDKATDIQSLLAVDALQVEQLHLFERGGAVYRVEDLADEAATIVRDAAFRKNVISLYDHRCAFCKLKVISRDSQNIVDGAHIKPFSEFRDDRFDNGLALCKNHHWAFDRGWFSIDDNYRIIIPSERFTEEPPEQSKPMREFSGELLYLPGRSDFHPRREALQWHRDRWQIA